MPQTAIEKRRLLAKQIQAIRKAPERTRQPREDRETAWKIRELERALDRAIRADRD